MSEYEALNKGLKNPTPPPITDDLSRWMTESQWSALDVLCTLPAYTNLAKVREIMIRHCTCVNECSALVALSGANIWWAANSRDQLISIFVLILITLRLKIRGFAVHLNVLLFCSVVHTLDSLDAHRTWRRAMTTGTTGA